MISEAGRFATETLASIVDPLEVLRLRNHGAKRTAVASRTSMGRSDLQRAVLRKPGVRSVGLSTNSAGLLGAPNWNFSAACSNGLEKADSPLPLVRFPPV
jgi:hypothetical protein